MPTVPLRLSAAKRAALLGGVWLGAFATLTPDAARAVDGTWTGPGAEWTTGTNWSSSPTVPDNTATFTNNGAPTSVTISSSTSINTIDFAAAAPAYSFSVQGGATFTINNTSNASSFVPAFSVNSGATLVIGDAGFVEIGSLANGTTGGGTVQIGTADPFTTLFIVGNSSTTFSGSFAGPGSLELENGAALTLNGASNGGNIGTIAGDLTLCNCSGGGLTIDGGALTVNGLFQGVTVFGGTLSVINGGTLQIGPPTGFSSDLLVVGSMFVSGTGSSVTVDGFTGIGVFGPGALTISNGGVLNSQQGAEIDSFFGVATATVTGPGSTWNVGGFGLEVGGGSTGGEGTLTISNGATVTASTVIIGDSASGSSTLTVTGAGSVLSATTSLAIGDAGCGCGPLVGTLTIADGGVVNSADTTIFAGSTLNLGTGGLAGSIVTPLILNDGRIAANFTDTATLAADISGSGALSKAGPGTLILTGTNTYTGGTTIDGGILQLGNGGASGSIAGNVTDNGTFAVNRSDTLTFSGVISGTGGFQQNGTGTTILTAANAYAGATAVNAGTLQAGAINTFAPNSAFTVAAGATLNLNNFNQTIGSLAGGGNVMLGSATLTAGGNNTSTTFSGSISGTGGLLKTGTGVLTLSGANTFSGGTTLAQGTLSLAHNQALGTGALTTTGSVVDYASGVNIANLIVLNSNGTQLQVQSAGAAIQSGIISEIGGSRPLEKIGNGTLILTANNTYTGPTTVNAGALIVDGALTNSAVTVNSGGTLGGVGSVRSLTINGGTLSPGNSIGTLTVNGNLVLSSAAAYLVEVSPSAADRTNVTGTASLAGTAQAIFQPGNYVGRSYTILSASGGRTGTFDSFNSNVGSGFSATLSYTATDVLLNLTATLGSGGSLNQNQQSVAGTINTFFNTGGALPPDFVTVFGLTGASLGKALTQLSGEGATGMQKSSFLAMDLFLNAMLDPFVEGRSGFGAAMGYAPERAINRDAASAFAAFTKAPPKAATMEERWGVWGASYGGYNRTDGDPVVVGSHDLTARTGGFAAGADYRYAPGSVLGVAVAIGETNWGLASGLGKGNTDVAQVGGYFSTRWNNFYVSGAVEGSFYSAKTDRFVFITGADHLRADFDAHGFSARLEGGWRYGTTLFGVTPYGAVRVLSVSTPLYGEGAVSGSDVFALTYAAQTTTDTRTELGAWFDTRHLLNNGASVLLRGRAAWVHDFNPDRRIGAIFQALPGANFVVDGARAAEDAALLSAAAEFRFANGVTLIGKFDGEFAGASQTYAGTGTIRYAW